MSSKSNGPGTTRKEKRSSDRPNGPRRGRACKGHEQRRAPERPATGQVAQTQHIYTVWCCGGIQIDLHVLSDQKMPVTCLVLQEAARGERAEQSPSHRELKNTPRPGLRSSDRPQVWWKGVYPQKSLSARHKIRWMSTCEDQLPPCKWANGEGLLLSGKARTYPT